MLRDTICLVNVYTVMCYSIFLVDESIVTLPSASKEDFYINASFVDVIHCFDRQLTYFIIFHIYFIQGIEKSKAYVASQGIVVHDCTHHIQNRSFDQYAILSMLGPMPHTIADFWRMILDLKLPTIVMLTEVEERGTVRMENYV